jgi:Rad3-related DNA helicase
VLIELVKVIPNGVLVLFSSYWLLETCCREFRNVSILGQFYKFKEVFFEDRNSVNFKEQLESFMRATKTTKGGLMFAVMRGKVAEGIDLCDE